MSTPRSTASAARPGRSASPSVRDGGRAVTLIRPDNEAGRDGVTATTFSVTVTTARLDEVARLLAEGRARIEIADRFPLDDAVRAHELIEDGHTRGKLVLIPG